jgi:hypothetical protein
VFCQSAGGQRWIATLDAQNRLTRWPATAGEAPKSPADVGTHIVYVRDREPQELRCLDVATGRTAPVQFAGLGAAEARPVAVAARGRDVAITYVQSGGKSPAARVVAVATWPASVPAGGVSLAGRWAVGHALADDAVALTPDPDVVLIAAQVGDPPATSASLALARAGGRARRLSYGFDAARAPALSADGRVAFLSAAGTLHVAPLPAAAVAMPAPMVFPAAPR